MANILDQQAAVVAQAGEQTALQQVQVALHAGQAPTLLGPDGTLIVLPPSVMQVLQQTIDYLALGNHVQVLALPDELSPQQAADLLNVSRTYLLKMLEHGDIPVKKIGTRRRIRLQDVLYYKQQRDTHERQGLAELARLSQEMNLYDDNDTP